MTFRYNNICILCTSREETAVAFLAQENKYIKNVMWRSASLWATSPVLFTNVVLPDKIGYKFVVYE